MNNKSSDMWFTEEEIADFKAKYFIFKNIAIRLLRHFWYLFVIAFIILITGSVFFIRYLSVPRTSEFVTFTKPVTYQTSVTVDCSLPKGTQQVTTMGADGVDTTEYKINYVNHKEVSRKAMSDKWTTQPIDEVVSKGIDDPTAYPSSYLPSWGTVSNNPCETEDAMNCEGVQDAAITDSDVNIQDGISTQQYSTYVQDMKKGNCGQVSPYCAFTAFSPCTNSVDTSSGYDAGYQYAEDNQICDPNYDNGDSQAFNDGVNAWTADNCTDGQSDN